MDTSFIYDRESLEPMLWRITIKWFDVDWIDEKHPKGQMNTIIYSYIPTRLTKQELEDVYKKVFCSYLEKKEKTPAEPESILAEYVGKQRWWLTWFAHETNQRFETEAEALADFDKWFYEAGLHHWVDFAPAGSHVNDGVIWCPMGAEDYWRRKACECDDCKKNGICRITH